LPTFVCHAADATSILQRIYKDDIGLTRQLFTLRSTVIQQRCGLMATIHGPSLMCAPKVELCDCLQSQSELVSEIGDIPKHVPKLFGCSLGK
jgi:hypothetical protein